MMSKFWYLTLYGIKKKLKSKAFIIVNIVLLLLMLFIFNIDSIVNFFGGDFEEKTTIYVVDNTDELYDDFNSYYKELSNMIDSKKEDSVIKSDEKREVLEEKIEDTKDIIILFDYDVDNYYSASVITESKMDNITYEIIVQSINNTKYKNALIKSNIDINELSKISNPVNINRIILDDEKTTSEEESMISDILFPIFIMPFFLLIIYLVQLIGGEINEEKTTRSMEIIISNVSAKVHFYSKLVANNVFVILQGFLYILYGFIGFFVRSLISNESSGGISDFLNEIVSSLSKLGITDQLYLIIPIFIVLMILSFIAYSLVSGIFASMTVNPEDFQSIQTPIMIMCMISYYLALTANMYGGSVFIRFVSYVPLISFLLSPSLLLIGQIGIIDVCISVIVLLVFNFFATKYGLKIYKVGILNYSTDKLWKRIFKAAKM